MLVDEEKKILFELKGESHGFCNLLKEKLKEDKDVKITSYRVKHPLIGVPELLIETNGKKSPQKALEEAIKRTKQQVKDFNKTFSKAKLWYL